MLLDSLVLIAESITGHPAKRKTARATAPGFRSHSNKLTKKEHVNEEQNSC
jgi:hypothetical protein